MFHGLTTGRQKNDRLEQINPEYRYSLTTVAMDNGLSVVSILKDKMRVWWYDKNTISTDTNARKTMASSSTATETPQQFSGKGKLSEKAFHDKFGLDNWAIPDSVKKHPYF